MKLPGTGPAVLELAADTVQLPDSIVAHPGDVVRFTAGDGATHALAFDGASLAAEARTFLERTSQMRSPPLITEGATWIISLADAPAGTYRFRCLTHNAAGALTVQR